MNAHERKLTLILGLCVGVLLIALFALIIWPQVQTMSKKADAATTAKNAAEAKLAQAKVLKKNEKNIDARLANLKARIPSSLELSNVINRVDERAVANNLTWLQGTPEDVTTLGTTTATTPVAGQSNTLAPQLERHDFTIIVQGTMPDFTKFMADLTDKSIGRIIVITSLDVQFKSDLGPNVVEATLKLDVIGWDKGADISSDGCTTKGTATSTDNSNSPDCNRTSVPDSSKEGTS